MKIFRDSKQLRKIKGPVLTLGNFDGLHLGHSKIVEKVVERAKKLARPSVVYTFEPHPLKVVAPHKSPPLILDSADKAKLIKGLGVDFLVFAQFTKEFAAKHPREFVVEEIVPSNPAEVWVGHDFSFGKAKSGSVEYLKKLGEEFGFKVFVIPAFKRSGEVVSSSRIRELIREGRVGAAKRLLSRNYVIKGRVVRGKDIGKAIGFPTANLKIESELIPGDGVYAAYALISGATHRAVLNIGTAPTFGGKDRCVEVHIFGFKDNIYGKKMEVSFVKRLRSEKAFKTKEALIRQITKDKERAEKIL